MCLDIFDIFKIHYNYLDPFNCVRSNSHSTAPIQSKLGLNWAYLPHISIHGSICSCLKERPEMVYSQIKIEHEDEGTKTGPVIRQSPGGIRKYFRITIILLTSYSGDDWLSR